MQLYIPILLTIIFIGFISNNRDIPSKRVEYVSTSFSPPTAGVTGVKAWWSVPIVDFSRLEYSLMGIELGGTFSGSKVLIQMGTAQFQMAGESIYFVWYQFFPMPPALISISINPGDMITASITWMGGDMWQITLDNANTTTVPDFTTIVTYAYSELDAQWAKKWQYFFCDTSKYQCDLLTLGGYDPTGKDIYRSNTAELDEMILDNCFNFCLLVKGQSMYDLKISEILQHPSFDAFVIDMEGKLDPSFKAVNH